MSRKTRVRRRAPDHAPKVPNPTPSEFADLEKPLALICDACGEPGLYQVGTVLMDPEAMGSRKKKALHESVGFSAYFRCHFCDAGGPWRFPDDTSLHLLSLGTRALLLEDDGDAPVVFAASQTFDKHRFRYPTEAEAHLKKLIDREPERAFLWVRLGNVYGHGGVEDRAMKAYERAIELDPKDVEAHFSIANILLDQGQYLDAVPHWHAVLKNARDARDVKKELLRGMVRESIECLLEAQAESHGAIDLLPKMDPEELAKRPKDEPVVLELSEFDLGCEEGMEDFCDMFLVNRRARRGLFGRPRVRKLPALEEGMHVVAAGGERVGRNEPCPCGSGHKYKKCCGNNSV